MFSTVALASCYFAVHAKSWLALVMGRAELRCAERCGGKALSVTGLELGRGLACGRRDGGLAGGCRWDLAGGVAVAGGLSCGLVL